MASHALRTFFVHVSKTGGTSISTFLASLFSASEICPGPKAGIWTYLPSEVVQYRLFVGHFGHDFIDGFPGEKIKLIMLRDPCARLVSLYDFWRSHSWDFVRTALPPPPANGPAVAKSCKFAEFLTTENAFVQQHVSNPIARQLLGTEFDTVAADERRAIELSISKLETFHWIGILAAFQASICMLAALLGSPEPRQTIWLNRTYDANNLDPDREPVARTIPTSAETVLMREVSRLDHVIYQHAWRIFRRQLRWPDSNIQHERTCPRVPEWFQP